MNLLKAGWLCSELGTWANIKLLQETKRFLIYEGTINKTVWSYFGVMYLWWTVHQLYTSEMR